MSTSATPFPRTKRLDARDTLHATPCDEDDNRAYLQCRGLDGYWFSLSRMPGHDTVEVMVVDQLNHRLAGLAVALEPGRLTVHVGAQGQAELDGHDRYEITFRTTPSGLAALDETLQAILRGTGTYVRLHESPP